MLLAIAGFILFLLVAYVVYRAFVFLKRAAEVAGSIPDQILNEFRFGAGN